jgi:putative ATP-dependent endonuclease of OLD family
VIFLYEAYLSVLVAEEFDKFATPILLIEEPEAHLHPSAVRLFWRFIEKMPGQKIISTHSGDIISSVPISKIRRICGTIGSNRIKRILDSAFSSNEKIKLRNYLTYNRGELFFAKLWLLVEGETEYIFLDNLLNNDGFLDKKGIRIIQCAHISAAVILKIANELNMPWFMITDGDTQGQDNRVKALSVLPQTANPDVYIYTFSESAIEVYLMNNGFSSFYLSKLNKQIQQNIKSSPGSLDYHEAVYEAIKNVRSISKPEIIFEILNSIVSGASSEPSMSQIIRQKLDRVGI